MKDLQPAVFRWDNISYVMVPLAASLPLCIRQFTDGEEYRLAAEEERSAASHKHYFAAIHEAWQNLPENLADRFPTAERLRHWCLVKCGYATEQIIVLETVRDAERFAEYVSEYRGDDTFVKRDGDIIKIWTAKSQSTRAMDKDEFQASKQAVLDLLSDMIGTTVTELKKNAGQAA